MKRFAPKALVFVFVFLVLFTIAQYISFLMTGVEQTTLIEQVFIVIGVEIGGLLLKRILEKTFGRKQSDADDDNFVE